MPLSRVVVTIWKEDKFMPEEVVLGGPQLRPNLLPQYDGPRGSLFHVSNLYYGLNECGTSSLPHNQGSIQFWKLLGTSAYGYKEFMQSGNCKKILKSGNKCWASILEMRNAILVRLKGRGIWLVDTSIYGWYMTQETKYKQSENSLEVIKKTKERPPDNLKQITLVYSWELYIKHRVRTSALYGHLRFIMPIGKSVGASLSRTRLEDVIACKNCTAVIEINRIQGTVVDIRPLKLQAPLRARDLAQYRELVGVGHRFGNVSVLATMPSQIHHKKLEWTPNVDRLKFHNRCCQSNISFIGGAIVAFLRR